MTTKFDWKRPRTTPEQCARIIELKAQGNMTLYQIAIEVDVPCGTVNNVLYKQRKAKVPA